MSQTVKLTGAQIVIKFLEDHGVKTVFGYPGGAVLPIYDALDTDATELRHHLVRQEAGAIHAAEGFARSTGKVGVALVTSGPGATNAVTGIANAYMDSTPLVVLTGQVPTHMIGLDSFQEIDTVGMTRPMTKHNFLVKDVHKLAETLRKAFYIASTGRPGPVVVDLPKNVQNQTTDYVYPETVSIRSYKPIEKCSGRAIKRAVELILHAKKPMVYAGGGIVLGNASDSLITFVKQLGFPITQTLMGLGGFPSNEPEFVGMLGMHGNYEANLAMHHADLIIALGARFDDRVTGDLAKFSPDAKVIHVDIDPASISKNKHADVPIVGPIKNVLDNLNEKLVNHLSELDQVSLDAWWDQINEWRETDCLKYKNSDTKIKPQFAVETLWKVTQGEAFICSDVGQHQMYAAQYYPFNKPMRWINSGGLGTMGFGLPAAMGVQEAHRDAMVAVITGDGSIQMNIQELATCLQYGWPIKIINLNNGYLGMVRQWQEFFYDSRYSMSYMESLPDFVQLAEAYGHVGMRVSDPKQLEQVLTEAFAMKDRLVFIDVLTEKTENVFPMMPAGAGHHEMLLS